jgi:TonB family protein
MTPPPSQSPFPGGSRPGSGGSRGGSNPSGSGPAAASQASTPSGFIGRYQVLEKIADGGMGSLYLARDPAIDRLVAIKLLRRGFDTESLRERFAREARAAGRLRHPNIVTVFDVGEHDGDPFIAMEFLAGETLGELIRQGARLSLSRRLKLLEELCDGLAYAHRAGLVHRDIKPANLMVDAEGVLKILDFGIVRVTDSGITQSGVLVGTINYMSPEQVLGTGVDHRSDIFAVGLVAYELLAGRQAFQGTMKDGLLKRIPEADIEPLSKVRPGLDPEVVTIVEHALKKEPADRFQELARMRNDLTRVRKRVEVEEELSAREAASSSAETAFIAEQATVAEPPPSRAPDLLADAERALADGQYRFAMTIAGRAAALDPQDGGSNSIVARAEAGLLDRGRAIESSASMSIGVATPVTPSQGAAVGQPPSTASVSNRATYGAVVVAVLALIVAGFSLWPQFRRVGENFVTTPAVESSIQAPQQPREPPATPPALSPERSARAEDRRAGEAADPLAGSPPMVNPPPTVEPPRPVTEGRRSPGARTTRGNDARRTGTRATAPPPAVSPAPSAPASPPSAPPEPVRLSAGMPVPARIHQVPPVYPAEATAAGIQGVVRVEVTVGEDGLVTEARVARSIPLLDSAALAAVRQWTFERPTVDGRNVSVVHTVDVPFVLPESSRTPATLPGSPSARPTAPPPPKPQAPQPPARDSRADAEQAVRDVLRRYEAAWESLQYDAVTRVHVLSPDEARRLRANIADMASYDIDINVHTIAIDADLRGATVTGTVTRRFRPRAGSADGNTVKQSFRLEKRGDHWVIVGLR